MKALIAVAFASVPGFPPGTTIDHLQATLSGAADSSQSVPPDATSLVFDNLPAGGYSISLVAIGSDGANLGTPATTTFTLTDTSSISLSLPATLTATQG